MVICSPRKLAVSDSKFFKAQQNFWCMKKGWLLQSMYVALFMGSTGRRLHLNDQNGNTLYSDKILWEPSQVYGFNFHMDGPVNLLFWDKLHKCKGSFGIFSILSLFSELFSIQNSLKFLMINAIKMSYLFL